MLCSLNVMDYTSDDCHYLPMTIVIGQITDKLLEALHRDRKYYDLEIKFSKPSASICLKHLRNYIWGDTKFCNLLARLIVFNDPSSNLEENFDIFLLSKLNSYYFLHTFLYLRSHSMELSIRNSKKTYRKNLQVEIGLHRKTKEHMQLFCRSKFLLDNLTIGRMIRHFILALEIIFSAIAHNLADKG